jgi:hypothetical protein
MALTYEKIATNTLGSAAASVTFSSISGSYTDLVLVVSGAMASGSGTFAFWQANGDTATNYSYTTLHGVSSSAYSDRVTNSSQPTLNYYSDMSTTLGQSVMVATWLNYSNTTTFKTTLVRSGNATGSAYPGTSAIVGMWRSTAAITSLAIKANGVNFATGSTFTLYGIKSA